ncbi:MAG: serine hydrolase [Deltaproteobacteria bacterium]|nr:serine hydrolase [Deltaproteobacteria bacterium]
MKPRNLRITAILVLLYLLALTAPVLSSTTYPELRECHNPALQKMLNKAMRAIGPPPENTAHKRQMGAVVADITDLKNPQVAWYKPDVMYYAASLPKIAIVVGVFAQIDQGLITLDSTIENQLIGMIRNSSNRYATDLLRLVGMKQLARILQDERYGKLYDPEYGGGLWVGKEYGKSSVRIGDPLHNISHGATAMQAARFYYGAITGSIIDLKHGPLLAKIFGKPAIKHKFVKGLEGRKNVEIYRKSGTWRDYHADSGVVVHDDFTYIVVYIEHHPEAGSKAVKGIRIVDDVMQAYAHQKK